MGNHQRKFLKNPSEVPLGVSPGTQPEDSKSSTGSGDLPMILSGVLTWITLRFPPGIILGYPLVILLGVSRGTKRFPEKLLKQFPVDLLGDIPGGTQIKKNTVELLKEFSDELLKEIFKKKSWWNYWRTEFPVEILEDFSLELLEGFPIKNSCWRLWWSCSKVVSAHCTVESVFIFVLSWRSVTADESLFTWPCS